MTRKYSTAEAKARFSELLRQVSAGERVVITRHGRDIAQISPIEAFSDPMEARMAELEAAGMLTRALDPSAPLGSVGRVPGALQRFLDTRD
ncbi:MAG: type II toxin-antitoxin system prevent-host-death family antitoxin [Myxococcota bacterium]